MMLRTTAHAMWVATLEDQFLDQNESCRVWLAEFGSFKNSSGSDSSGKAAFSDENGVVLKKRLAKRLHLAV